jgi:membrane protease YdiL (CAAX protease family)
VQPDFPSPRPPAWPALAAYLAGFALALGSSVAVVFAVALARSSGGRSSVATEAQAFALSAPGLLYGALVSAAALATVALVTARLEGKSIVARLRIGPTRASWLGVLEATGGLIGLNLACATTGEMLGARGSGVMDAMTLALQSPSPGRFLAALATLGIAPGLAEELFFRGLIQTRLVASWGRWPGIITASAAFGLIHLDPLQGSIALAAGLYLGWIVERFGGVRPSILAHAVNNAVVVALGAFGSGSAGTRPLQWAIVAVGAAACVASIVLLRGRRAKTPEGWSLLH